MAGDVFGLEQRLHPAPYFVADSAYLFERQAFRIAQGPVAAFETRDIRTLVTTAHGDKELGLRGEFKGQLLRSGAA